MNRCIQLFAQNLTFFLVRENKEKISTIW